MLQLNKIYNIDFMEGLKQIDDNSIDLIITDPPYALKINSTGPAAISHRMLKIKKELDEKGLQNGYDIEETAKEIKRVQKHINAYFFCSKNQLSDYLNVYVNKYKCQFYILEWHKSNPSPLFFCKYLSDTEYCLYFFEKGHKLLNPSCYEDAKSYWIQPLNKSDKDKYHHPTCKPVNILQTLVRNSSKEGDVVLDMFIGSGSSAIACMNEKRNYIGFEIDEEYYNTSLKRIEDNGQ